MKIPTIALALVLLLPGTGQAQGITWWVVPDVVSVEYHEVRTVVQGDDSAMEERLYIVFYALGDLTAITDEPVEILNLPGISPLRMFGRVAYAEWIGPGTRVRFDIDYISNIAIPGRNCHEP